MTLTTVAEQNQHAVATFRQVEQIEEVAATVDEHAAAKLREVVTDMIESTPPVRISAAAELLDLSKPTVTAWCERGVLTLSDFADGTTVRTLDPRRLHEVLHIVRDLRELANKPGNLVEQVWHRLQDRAELESDDLREGMAAWRDGDVLEA